MAHYIDGFVFPIPRDRLNEYQRLAQAAAEVWKEHGALHYWEYVGDDLKLEGTRSFTELVAATADETIVLKQFNPFDRETFKHVTGTQAMEILRRKLVS